MFGDRLLGLVRNSLAGWPPAFTVCLGPSVVKAAIAVTRLATACSHSPMARGSAGLVVFADLDRLANVAHRFEEGAAAIGGAAGGSGWSLVNSRAFSPAEQEVTTSTPGGAAVRALKSAVGHRLASRPLLAALAG